MPNPATGEEDLIRSWYLGDGNGTLADCLHAAKYKAGDYVLVDTARAATLLGCLDTKHLHISATVLPTSTVRRYPCLVLKPKTVVVEEVVTTSTIVAAGNGVPHRRRQAAESAVTTSTTTSTSCRYGPVEGNPAHAE
jgi:hypothetical protein